MSKLPRTADELHRSIADLVHAGPHHPLFVEHNAKAIADAGWAAAYQDFAEEASVTVRAILKPGVYRDRLLDALRAIAARERLARVREGGG